MNTGDIVLVGLREFQDAKADIILKYTPDEARNLKHYGEIPDSTALNEGASDDEDQGDLEIEFEYDEVDDI